MTMKIKPYDIAATSSRIRSTATRDHALSASTTEKTHALDRHAQLQTWEYLDRLFSNDTFNEASYFDSPDAAENLINKAIAASAQDIAQFLCDCYESNTRPSVAFTVPLNTNESNMRGFAQNLTTGQIYEATSNKLSLVVKYNPDADLGFETITAYPALYTPDGFVSRDVRKTNRDVLPDLVKTEKYGAATDTEKLYLVQCCSPDHNVPMQYDAQHDTIRLRLPSPDPMQHVTLIARNKNGQLNFSLELYKAADKQEAATRKVPKPSQAWDNLAAKWPNNFNVAEKLDEMSAHLPAHEPQVSAVFTDNVSELDKLFFSDDTKPDNPQIDESIRESILGKFDPSRIEEIERDDVEEQTF